MGYTTSVRNKKRKLMSSQGAALSLINARTWALGPTQLRISGLISPRHYLISTSKVNMNQNINSNENKMLFKLDQFLYF